MWRYLLSLLLFTDHVIVPAFYVPLRPLGGRNVGISSVNHVASDAASSYYGTRQPRLAEEAGSVLHAAVTVGGEQMSGESTSAGTKSDVLDFAIIGAGPAGLALAVSLCEKGCRVKVFESVGEIQERGAAVFVQPFGLAALDQVKAGLAAEATAVGRIVECIHLTRPDGSTISKLDMVSMKELVGYPFIGITRYALQRVLLDHLPDDVVELGCRLDAIDDGGVEGLTELTFQGRLNPVLAKAVVGADGRRSTVRDRILAPNEDKNDWALTWWALADVKNTSVPPGEFRMSYAKGRAVYYGEVQDGLTMWSCTSWKKGGIERNPELRASRALEALEGWPDEVTDMVKSTSPSRLIEVFVGDSPLQWLTWSRKPGATLVGDAAHAMLPSLGMGVTTALQDVTTLSSCVDGPETPMVEALAEYERQRRIPATFVQLASRFAMLVIEKFLCG